MRIQAIDIVILSCLVVSGALVVSSYSNPILPIPSIPASPEALQELDEKEAAAQHALDAAAAESELRRESLSLVPEYLFEQAVHNAELYGYTEVHKIGDEVRYYSYNPALKVGASWLLSEESEDGVAEYREVKIYPALELMPFHIELNEQSTISKFRDAEYLKEGNRFLQTTTVAATYYRIDFRFDTLISMEKKTEQGGSVFIIEYFNTVHPELSAVVASLIDSLPAG
jgi:hypothetical protein